MKPRTVSKCLVSILLLVLLAPPFLKAETDAKEVFEPLLNKLIEEGLPQEFVLKVFSDPRVRFVPQIMPKKLTWDETKLPYQRFLQPERIKRAKKFLDDYDPLLTEIENLYGVEKEVLVAILLVESDLGRHRGRFEVFNVLASMAVSSDWERVKRLINRPLSPSEEARLKRIMKRRSRWAYEELKVFLKKAYEEGFDPLEIKGSIFGAFGIPQFVPSSYANYAVDGNGDGKVDLYCLADALASAANYLKKHGWRKDLPLEKKKKILMYYNRSKPYVETVMKIAQLLSSSDSRVSSS